MQFSMKFVYHRRVSIWRWRRRKHKGGGGRPTVDGSTNGGEDHVGRDGGRAGRRFHAKREKKAQAKEKKTRRATAAVGISTIGRKASPGGNRSGILSLNNRRSSPLAWGGSQKIKLMR